MESAEGKTTVGWSGGMPRKNFAKLRWKYAFSFIIEVSFSNMLLRDLLEEWNRKMKILQNITELKARSFVKDEDEPK